MFDQPREPRRDAAQDRQVDQCHNERCRQHEDQGHGEHPHEFPWHTGPEQHRQEGAERRRGGGDDGPEHALGGIGIGLHRAGTLGQALVGIFDHHDGPVDQHPHGQDQPEHDDIRDRDAHDPQQDEAQKERGRDREPHQQRRARAEGCQHHDHHQRDGGQDRAFQLADHAFHGDGLIQRGGDLDGLAQLGRPVFLRGLDLGAHQRGGVDDVVAKPFDHLQRHRGFAVEARGAGAVLVGQANIGQIAKRHHAVAIDLDGQGKDVLGIVEARRDRHRDGTTIGGNLARRDQLVVVHHRVDQFARGDIVGLQRQRVDDDLDHLVAVACKPRLQNGRQRLQPVLQFARKPQERAFRRVARERHDDDGKLGKVDLVDRVGFGAFRELGRGRVHRVAHIGDGGRLVPTELELQEHAGIALGGGGGDRVQAVEILELGLHRAHQQAFAVGGGNAGEGDRDEEAGDVDIRLALFRQADIGRGPDHDGQDHEGHHHAGPFRGPVHHADHCVMSP